MKASLADDEETSATTFTVQTISKQLRQRDINIGVILTFAGAFLAAFVAGPGGPGPNLGREGGALILAISFISILLFSRPILRLIYRMLSWEPDDAISFNQRGMSFGSILMFTSTILLALSSLLMFGRMRTPQFLFALAGAFVLLLFISKHLMQALRYLVAGEVSLPQTAAAHVPVGVTAAGSDPVLAAEQSVPVSLFTGQRVTTAEILSPPSVTEHTTNLLENE